MRSSLLLSCTLAALALPLHAAEPTTTEAEVPVQALPTDAAPADTRERRVRNNVLLEEVVVTGTRTEQPLSRAPVEVQLIGAKQIAQSGARDLAELGRPACGIPGPEGQGQDRHVVDAHGPDQRR